MKYQLSQAQVNIVTTELNNTSNGSYNIKSLFILDDNVDLEKLTNSIIKTGDIHPLIKSKLIQEDDGTFYFESHDEEKLKIDTQNFSDEKSFYEYADNVPDFLKSPLYRISVGNIGKEKYLFTDFHHVISDGWSLQVFLNDVSDLYSGKIPQSENISNFEITEKEISARKSNQFEEDKNYFSSVLSGADECSSLPLADIYGKTEQHFSSCYKTLDFNKDALTLLEEKLHTTEAKIFTAAYSLTLSKFTGSDQILFSTAFHGRSDKTTERTFTMLVKTIPIFQDISKINSVSDLISQTGKQLSDSRKHTLFSYEEILRKFKLTIDSYFVYHGKLHSPELLLDKKPQSFKELTSNTPGLKFISHLNIIDGKYVLHIEYPDNLFTKGFIENFAECYQNIFSEMLVKDELNKIEICSRKQIETLNSFIPSKYENYDDGKTVVSLFKENVKKYPDLTCAVFKEKRYTFKELDEITDILSVYIANTAEKKDGQGVVSILIPRNEFMIILPLACQKAGFAFQPLDPGYPKDRLNFMVNDASASLVFADPSLKDILDYSGKIILTSEIDGIIQKGIKSPLPVPSKSDDAFILLYTSGSTGNPKGVILEQRNIVAFCSWFRNYYRYNAGDNFACYASFGFDVHMIEIYCALTSGYTCHIIPEEIRLDLIELNNYFEKNKIIGTVITTQVGVQFVQNIEKTSLKNLIVGGEKLVSVNPPENYQLINAYGPTETTIFVTSKPVNEKEENIPIGKPLDNVRCYIVDKNMHRVPFGAPGELIIAGPQVARGYLNRPEKTSEVFIRDPFAIEKSDYLSRAYKTGDIVRWRENGDIEFIGRRDHQVKIHGYRIELKEIEACIREFKNIKDVSVQVFDGQGGEKFIAAYVVSSEKINIEEIKKFISEKKPYYMVPSFVIQLEKIPLNQNQKVDRQALPVPALDSNENAPEESSLNIPLNALETEIKALVSKVIGTDNFGLSDKLSRLGLTSISAIRLATLVYKKYGVSIKGSRLVSEGTLRLIENEILKRWMNEKDLSKDKVISEKPSEPDKSSESGKSSKTSFDKKTVEKIPLSFSQRGVFAECLSSPENTLYNIPFCINFPDEINANELKNAVTEVVLCHPSFSTRFTSDEKNETIQYFEKDYKPEISIKKMNEEDFDEYKKSFVHPFDLFNDFLYRFEIILSDKIYLLIDIHHLISDGFSIDLFIKQLCECLEGKKPEKEEYTYLDYTADEKISPETEKFFEEQMSDFEEATQLIPDVFEKDLPHTEGIVSVKTDLNAVSKFARENNITPASVYLAAEYIAASRFTAEDKAAITTISNGRSNLKIFNTMGMFINTLPLLMKIDNKEETVSFIKKVAENYSSTIEHENYPFSKIVSKFDFHASLSYTYQVGVFDKYSVRGKDVFVKELSLDKAKLPCSVYIVGSEKDDGIIQVNYDESLYTKDMMKNFAQSIENVVCGLMSKKTLSEISLTSEDQWKILDSYNRPFDLNYDHSDTVVSLFKKQIKQNPDKIAATYKEKKYSFKKLDDITDYFAEYIYDKLTSITKSKNLSEHVIPIITERSENAFILPLAVLKTGAAYAPLDPDYPSDRLNFMVQDSSAEILIAQRGLETKIDKFGGKVIFIDEIFSAFEKGIKNKIAVKEIPAPEPEDLLIMLYTSGTTGMPKGVQLIHENLVSFTHGSALDGLYTKESKTATYASFGFDVNMADTFCTMLNGGTVYLIPEEARMDLSSLAEYFDKEEITDVLLTTQVGVQFINSFPKLKTLKMLTVGGEKLPAINIENLSYKVYNGYGPTENCAGVSLFHVNHWEPNIPIGKPFPSINAFVLDKTGHRLPSGAAGEYCLSGPQVGRGYLNREEKTKEAFEECPFNQFRMYHTGDIVRYRENGDVEFVGRKDGQVKIRGFRVELKEIESILLEYEGITDATVQTYEYEDGGKYLAAFITGNSAIDTKKVSDFIRSNKPAYMVPPVIMQIEKIPLTVNRKVDKKALPKPELKKTGYVAPETKTEKDFCNIFGSVLGIEKVGVMDDFFELGGSSILVMKVVLAAAKAGYEIVYKDVFTYTTPKELSAFTDETSSDNDAPDKSQEYDYTEINSLLCKNTLEAFRNGKAQEINDVLLTGATGFLGIHVLNELIKTSPGKIFCFIRNKNGITGENRLKEYLRYYFNNDFNALFGKRIFVIEGDTTDPEDLNTFSPEDKITVINCAANVSHFAKDDSIWKANVNSVQNLIAWCLEHDSRLVHVSTGSVSGSSKNGIPGKDFTLDEHILYGGQIVEDNQYVHSKFMAEREIYEAILKKNLNAKVIRVCNLAPRYSDGKVQINFKTNNFLCTLKAFKVLEKISYSLMNELCDLSPIEYVAGGIIKLAHTPCDCICFILANEYMPKMGRVLLSLSDSDKKMELVEDEEFSVALKEALNNPEKSDAMRPLLAYSTSKNEKNIQTYGFEVIDASYTQQILYRLGFNWPMTDSSYLGRLLKELNDNKFFEE
ncbi:MAG: amino acid adenylation domain-containing protein [Treponema sp.]|nr:amino acid adenylation domain-containing protein [Candidatus Treponema merdequi]